jgi:hypothetical protein
VCINWPQGGKSDPDFNFDTKEHSELDYQDKSPDTKTAETRKESTEAAAKIDCFDYGAFADLEVTAEIGGISLAGMHCSIRPSPTFRRAVFPNS